MRALKRWFVHETTVERYAGSGPEGDVYDGPVTVAGLVEQEPKLVRSSTGEEVVSSARVFYPADTAYIPPRSYVTTPTALGGIRSEVISCAVHDAGPLPVPGHVEVAVA